MFQAGDIVVLNQRFVFGVLDNHLQEKVGEIDFEVIHVEDGSIYPVEVDIFGESYAFTGDGRWSRFGEVVLEKI